MANDLNIAYVDLDKIINQSTAGKKIIKQIESLNSNNTKKFKKKENKLIEEEKNIIKQENILSKKDYEIKVKNLQKKVINFRNDIKVSRKNLDKKRIDATSKLLKVLNPIFSEYSSKNSISLIIQKKYIVIGKADLEITDKILELLNKKIKTIELN